MDGATFAKVIIVGFLIAVALLVPIGAAVAVIFNWRKGQP